MAARRFDDVSPAIDFLVDAVLGTALMLVAHYAWGWVWFLAALFGYGSISTAMLVIMYEELVDFDDWDWWD